MKPCTDHLGNKFKNIYAMLTHYQLTYYIYNKRRKKNWSLEQTLTTPISESEMSQKQFITKDHKGNTFPSKTKMAEYYNIPIDLFHDRIRKGMSTEEALTTPVKKYYCQDEFGNKFPNQYTMAKTYGINYTTFLSRTKKGLSQIEALGIIPCINNHITNWTFDNTFKIIHPIKKSKYYYCILNNHDIIMTHDKIIEYCLNQLKQKQVTS